MRKISIVPVILFLFSVILLLALFYNGNRISEKVAFMSGQNDKLKKENQVLKSQIQELNLKVAASDLRITILTEEDEKLRNKYQNAQNQINRLKPKYDKANNFSRNFTNDSIRIYFSNLE